MLNNLKMSTLSVSGPQAIRISGTICMMCGIIYGLNNGFKYFLKYAISGPQTPQMSVDESCNPLSMILTGGTMLLIANNAE